MKSRVGAAIVVLPETFDFECLHVATALENFAPLDVEKKQMQECRCRYGIAVNCGGRRPWKVLHEARGAIRGFCIDQKRSKQFL